jgi:HSP20 family molecular chaperone IbpA
MNMFTKKQPDPAHNRENRISFFARRLQDWSRTKPSDTAIEPAFFDWRRVDVEEDESEYRITARLPGVDATDIQISVEGEELVEELTIVARRRFELPVPEDKSGLKKATIIPECQVECETRFLLPPDAQGDQWTSTFDNETLMVHIPKALAEPTLAQSVDAAIQV